MTTQESKTVRVSEVIAPSFLDVHRDIKAGRHTHYWLKGGRGSCKSSFVSVEIILGIMRNPGTNAVCLRKVGLYLKDSVYEQLLWAISALGCDALWRSKLSPLELIYIPTGQRILFRGADQPKKIKSTKVSTGYIRYIWYEEADEFAGQEEIDVINQSLLRGGEKFDVFYSYNPPKSVRNWVNTAVCEPKADKLVHHSDYLTVPREWLGAQFISEAEHLRDTKPERYANEYLGEVTGTGAEVFPNIIGREITDEEICGYDRVYRGLDWGFGADPFAYVALGHDSRRGRIVIFYEFYQCGARFETIQKAIQKENTRNALIMAESAEPRSNNELREMGLRLQAVRKGQGSVEHGITWLQNLNEIVIDPRRCPNAFREFSQYELESDNRGGYRDGFPDKNNHTIDAVRYALESVIGSKKIKTFDRTKWGIY